jgi:type IV fimbrial biogenesis protein FimT
MRPQNAFSYIEIILTIACLSLLVAAVIPDWQQYRSANRLLQAAETLAQDLRSARSLALIHNTPYFIYYDNADESWCYLLTTHSDCHCLAPSPEPACLPGVATITPPVSADDFPGIYLTEALFGTQALASFEPIRGTARFGHLLLEDNYRHRLQINVSRLGRIRICHPQDSIRTGSYPAC